MKDRRGCFEEKRESAKEPEAKLNEGGSGRERGKTETFDCNAFL